MEVPGTLAIQDKLFIQDHHPIGHSKHKRETCVWIWKRGCGHRWCLSMHKFCCCVNRWKLEGKNKIKKKTLAFICQIITGLKKREFVP